MCARSPLAKPRSMRYLHATGNASVAPADVTSARNASAHRPAYGRRKGNRAKRGPIAGEGEGEGGEDGTASGIRIPSGSKVSPIVPVLQIQRRTSQPLPLIHERLRVRYVAFRTARLCRFVPTGKPFVT